jgi:hypothetical protein
VLRVAAVQAEHWWQAQRLNHLVQLIQLDALQNQGRCTQLLW